MSAPAASILEHFDALAALIATQELKAREGHANFNVFAILRPSHDEVRLHTRFLHGLLDPKGRHDCDSLFLDLFFATLVDSPPTDHHGNPAAVQLPVGARDWTLAKETRRGRHGQIDLLLTSAGCAIAIENKIYAAEQPGQLSGYHDYLAGTCKACARVLFLTLDGHASSTADGRPYFRISYQRHILAWLDRCVDATKDMPPLNPIIRQYREVVRQLTGCTLDTPHMKSAVDFVRSKPDIIACLPQIQNVIAEVRADFLDQIAAGLKERLSPDFRVADRERLLQGRFGKDPNGAFILKPRAESPLARFEIWIEHIAEWKDGLVVGIKARHEKSTLSAEDQALFARMNQRLIQHQQESDHHKSDPLTTWRPTWWPTGYHNLIHPFDDQKLAALLKQPFSEVLDDLETKIRKHIELLEKFCLAAQAVPPSPASVSNPSP